jgi:hypothetical protein
MQTSGDLDQFLARHSVFTRKARDVSRQSLFLLGILTETNHGKGNFGRAVSISVPAVGMEMKKPFKIMSKTKTKTINTFNSTKRNYDCSRASDTLGIAPG